MPAPGRLVLTALLLAALAPAEDPETPGAPQVWETDLLDWDAAALAAGEWVEYELSAQDVAAPPGKRPARRYACVAVEEETAWVEVTERNSGPAREGMVLLLGVRRKDGLVAAAFWGRSGGTGSAVKPTSGAPGMPAGPVASRPTVTGSGSVSREKLKAGGATLDCEKVELRTELTSSCCNEKARTTLWISEKVPFRARVGEKPLVKGVEADITWASRPVTKGGLVKKSVFRNNATETLTLLRHGSDAVPALGRPR